MRITPPNKALHRTAICAWRFALEFFLFISQVVAVGELTSEVIRQAVFLGFCRTAFERRSPQFNLIEQRD